MDFDGAYKPTSSPVGTFDKFHLSLCVPKQPPRASRDLAFGSFGLVAHGPNGARLLSVIKGFL